MPDTPAQPSAPLSALGGSPSRGQFLRLKDLGASYRVRPPYKRPPDTRIKEDTPSPEMVAELKKGKNGSWLWRTLSALGNR